MRKVFVVKNKDQNITEFDIRIDDDGDMVLSANGIDILYVSYDNSEVVPIHGSADDRAKAGLLYDTSGHLFIYGYDLH